MHKFNSSRSTDLHIQFIIETHVDFVGGSKVLKARQDEEPTIHCSSYGGKNWTLPYPDQLVKKGDTVELDSVHFGFQPPSVRPCRD